MDAATFLLATATAHVSFAIGVVLHARMTGESAARWPYLTLLFGLAGVAGYLFYEDG